jgi:hypothetical protein
MTRQPTHQLSQLIILILQMNNIMCKFQILQTCISQVEHDVGMGSFNVASRELV